MKKINNKGFMLAETLIVTSFVAGVLIYVYIQFTNLNKNYNEAYIFNTVEGLYALEDIKNYILTDNNFLNYIEENINSKSMDITDCKEFTNQEYCNKLFKFENIDTLIISTNQVKNDIYNMTHDDKFKTFMKKIKSEGSEKYRLIAKFKDKRIDTKYKDSTFATVRLGD